MNRGEEREGEEDELSDCDAIAIAEDVVALTHDVDERRSG